MTHLLTTIGPCLLLTMAVVTPSTTEAINFKAPTAAHGGNLQAFRPHPSPSVSPRWRELEPFTGGVGLYPGHTGAYATESTSGSGEPDPIFNWFRSTGFLLAVVLRSKRLPSQFKLNKHIPRGL
jgi:hypothetical protein